MARFISYKNMLAAKICKPGVVELISFLYFCTAMNIEERRADNFANAHADKEALCGAIEIFKKTKKGLQEHLPIFSDNLSFCVQKILDPIHPSIDSRIEKIKGVLKARYGVD